MRLSSRRIIKASDLQAADRAASPEENSLPESQPGGGTGVLSRLQPQRQRLAVERELRELRQRAEEEAERIISDARAQQQEILNLAREEILRLREEQVKAGYEAGFAQGREEGFKTGFTEGRAQGLEQVKRDCAHLLQQLADTVKEAAAVRDSALERSEEDVLKLSLAVAEKIIRSRVLHDPAVTANVVKAALERVNGSHKVRVRVHPSLVAAMEEHLPEFSTVKGIEDVEFVEDPQVEPGGCLVETDFGRVDGRLESRLEEIASALLEVMDHGR